MLRPALLSAVAALLLTVSPSGNEAFAQDEAAVDLETAVTAAMEDDAILNRGRRLYLQCRTCHTLAEGDAHKVGPNLWAIFGNEAGSRPGFENYSDVLKDSGIVWDAATLDEWLTKPREFLPGNRMAFAGVRQADDRIALIAYIKTETGFSE